eukprot:7900670-Pyramimonas_sp.AAC.1
MRPPHPFRHTPQALRGPEGSSTEGDTHNAALAIAYEGLLIPRLGFPQSSDETAPQDRAGCRR